MQSENMSKRSQQIVHFVPKEAKSVSSILAEHFKLEKAQQELLFQLGAMYVNKNRLISDTILKPKEQLQVYLHPKRYLVGEIDWKKTIVHEQKEFVVINKPSGIPVHATEDNLIENVLHQLKSMRVDSLWVTHRLDASASGLMVLAKTQKFQAEFNDLVSQRKVAKFYRALTERKPPLGLIRHYMSPEEKLPKKLSQEMQKGWLECLLEVKSISPWKSSENQEFWEVEIQLHTGRTHQIRAQISWSGAPILGDKMYRGRNRAGFTKSKIALKASKLEWKDSSGTHRFELPSGF